MAKRVTKQFETALSAEFLWKRILELERAPAQPEGLNMTSKDWVAIIFQMPLDVGTFLVPPYPWLTS